MKQILISFSEDDFEALISKIVSTSIADLRSEIKTLISDRQPLSVNEENYLSAKEISAKYPISVSTIRRYQKNGILIPKRIGGKVLFLEKDVIDSIQSPQDFIANKFKTKK